MRKLLAWVEENDPPAATRIGSLVSMVRRPKYQEMLRLLVDGGTAMWLNPEKRHNSILVRSDTGTWHASRTAPSSVRRSPRMPGPTNN
jgi:hypothetical protein